MLLRKCLLLLVLGAPVALAGQDIHRVLMRLADVLPLGLHKGEVVYDPAAHGIVVRLKDGTVQPVANLTKFSTKPNVSVVANSSFEADFTSVTVIAGSTFNSTTGIFKLPGNVTSTITEINGATPFSPGDTNWGGGWNFLWIGRLGGSYVIRSSESPDSIPAGTFDQIGYLGSIQVKFDSTFIPGSHFAFTPVRKLGRRYLFLLSGGVAGNILLQPEDSEVYAGLDLPYTSERVRFSMGSNGNSLDRTAAGAQACSPDLTGLEVCTFENSESTVPYLVVRHSANAYETVKFNISGYDEGLNLFR